VSSALNLAKLSPKFDSIARCLERLESKKPFTLETLCTDFDLQDIISTNIVRAIQLTVDVCTMILSRTSLNIPGEMGQLFAGLSQLGWLSAETALKLKKMIGLRNIMIHEYEKIDWVIVFHVTENCLGDIKAFVREVSAKLVD
jgi:uncharacterized protein YutE (UPF0331/DUF86 family)